MLLLVKNSMCTISRMPMLILCDTTVTLASDMTGEERCIALFPDEVLTERVEYSSMISYSDLQGMPDTNISMNHLCSREVFAMERVYLTGIYAHQHERLVDLISL
jgi:hypothetical protein